MTHEELFTAYFPRMLPITVMETPDGHLYPMGSFHNCGHEDCPAHLDEAPETLLGDAGPIEQEFRRQFGVEASQEKLDLVRELCL